MTSLSYELDRYLTIRRSLGHKLTAPERILRRFIGFIEAEGDDRITAELFMRWHDTFGEAGRETWAQRLTAVRIFARWLQGLDPKHEEPSARLLPYRHRRQRPYIYSEGEIREILNAAAVLRSRTGLRSLSYPVLFGLLAVTGLRISEALSLDDDEVDLDSGVIMVRRGKFGKERLVPVDETTRQQLLDYMRTRDQLLGGRALRFFVGDKGEPITDNAARYSFAQLCQATGLRVRQHHYGHGRGPRIHDLRHTFAVRTLISWYRTGKDPDREMIKLSTYLGHTEPANTYWYIEAVPELLELARKRADGFLNEEVSS